MKTTLLFLLLAFSCNAQEGMTAAEVYMLRNQNPRNMKPQKYERGDIIELASGRICIVEEHNPASAHIRCREVWSSDTFYPLNVKVKKVLRRYAEIKRTRNKQFRFNLIGDNGEIIGTSEMYTTKAKALNTVKQYHKTFKIVDKT